MREAIPAVAAPLFAAAWLTGCTSTPETNNVAAAALPPKAPLTPAEAAHRLVLARLGVQGDVAFSDEQVYAGGGPTVVCGRYAQAGEPLRYIAIGSQDVFVEGDYRGDIGEAVAEACRPNAPAPAPSRPRVTAAPNRVLRGEK